MDKKELENLGEYFLDIEKQIINDTNENVLLLPLNTITDDNFKQAMQLFFQDNNTGNNKKIKEHYRSLFIIINNNYISYKNLFDDFDRLSLKINIQFERIIHQEQLIENMQDKEFIKELIKIQRETQNAYSDLKQLKEIADKKQLKAIEKSESKLQEILGKLEEYQKRYSQKELPTLADLEKNNILKELTTDKDQESKIINLINTACDYLHKLYFIHKIFSLINTSAHVKNNQATEIYLNQPLDLLSYGILLDNMGQTLRIMDRRGIKSDNLRIAIQKYAELYLYYTEFTEAKEIQKYHLEKYEIYLDDQQLKELDNRINTIFELSSKADKIISKSINNVEESNVYEIIGETAKDFYSSIETKLRW